MNNYPKHWVTAAINDTGEYINGFAFRPSHRATTGRPIIRIQNLTKQNADFNLTEYLPDDKYLIKNGTLLVSWSATLDVFVWNGPDGVLNQHIFKVIPNLEVVDKDFLYFLLKTVVIKLRESEQMRGTTMRHINRKPFLEHPIALPPLAEQIKIKNAILAAFSQIKKIENKVERLLSQASALKAALFREATEGHLSADWRKENQEMEPATELLERTLNLKRFRWEERRRAVLLKSGKDLSSDDWKKKYPTPVLPDLSDVPALPRRWAWASLDQLAEIRSGITLNQQDQPSGGKMVPYLRVANVQRGYLDLSDVKEVSVSPKDLEELLLEEGDILFNEGGDRDKLGRGWVWEGQLDHCIHQNHVFRARPVTDELKSRFVSIWANTFGKAYFERVAKQTTNLASINLGKLAQLPVPLPPFVEQQEILSKIEKAFDLINLQEVSLKDKLEAVENLRRKLLASAFSGTLIYAEVNMIATEELIKAIRQKNENISVSSTKPKAPNKMKKSLVQFLSLREVLLNHPDGLTSSELLRESKYSIREVDAFYDELFSLHDSKVLVQIDNSASFEPLLYIRTSPEKNGDKEVTRAN